MSVRCEIKNYKILQKRLEEMKKAPRTVITQLTKDASKRVPPWIAAEVSKVYGIKKTDISGQKIGKVKVIGQSFDELQVKYTGRVLTHTRFSMSPKVPKVGGSYTLKATTIRGQRETLGKVKKLTKKQRAEIGKNFSRSGSQKSDHSPIMLMHTGNAQAEGTNYIPFQRKSKNRKNVQAIKTVSLPQMVSSERTDKQIQTAINDGLSKRLDHYMQRYMGK